MSVRVLRGLRVTRAFAFCRQEYPWSPRLDAPPGRLFSGLPGVQAAVRALTRLRRDLGGRRAGRVRRIGADAELQGLQRELQLGVRLQPADVQVDEAAAGLLRHLELLDLVLLRPGARDRRVVLGDHLAVHELD